MAFRLLLGCSKSMRLCAHSYWWSGNPATNDGSLGGLANGTRPKFNSADSAVEAVKTSSPLKDSLCNKLSNVDRLNLSAISTQPYNNGGGGEQKKFTPFVTLGTEHYGNGRQTTSNLQQTPDWIRDIFQQAKKGNLEYLVSFHQNS